MPSSFYIIDGHAQIYRAFYAPFRELTSPSGEPTRATYVFCQMLFQLIRERKPDYLAMVLDVSDRTVFRCDLYPEYKANRDPAPEALHVQADRIESIVSALGIPVFSKEGFEADDLMATMVERLRDDDLDVFLVSSDKDLHQLLSEKVSMFDISKGVVLDPAALAEKHKYSPGQAVEIQTLVGDSTDNIPGVMGIGPKTAVKLIDKYGTAENVLKKADELTPKMRERTLAFADQMPITRQLVTLRRDVEIDFDHTSCKLGALNAAAVLPVFEELGFGRLKDTLQDLASDGDGEGVTQTPVKQEVQGSFFDSMDDEEVEYALIDTREKLQGLVDSLSKLSSFAFDTETTGLSPVGSKLVGISFSWKAGEAYYVPVRGIMSSTVDEQTIVELLGPIMEDASIGKVGQNIKYDVLVLRQIGIETKGIIFDTMIASFLLEPTRRSHSLDALALMLCGHQMVPISDLIGKGKSQITMDQVDIRQTCEYAAEDADYTWRLMEILKPQVEGSEIEPIFRDTEMPLVSVLAEMEHNGIALNTDLLSELSLSMEEDLQELTEKVHEAVGYPFNIDSTKQLAEVLFDELGLPSAKKTKTGRSTDAETLEKLAAEHDNPVPGLVLQYRELRKLKGTYVDPLPRLICERTGRLHASFNQIGAITGRLSSSDPNLQNIPIRTEAGRRIREAVIPRDPDHVLLAADYSQIELRLLAHFCQDDGLLNAFRQGLDIHRAVAAQVNEVGLDDVTSEQRSAAKAVNFGIVYGQTAFGLARSLGISRSDAQAFIDGYFDRYPGIGSFMDRCVADAKRQGFVQTILGRRRPIPEVESRNPQQQAFGRRIAVNTVVQGSAADLIKRAMISVHNELQGGGLKAKMLIQVHDELVFDVPRDCVEDEADAIKRMMESAMALDVPIVADVAWGNNWAEGK